jgi:hypothetical protein
LIASCKQKPRGYLDEVNSQRVKPIHPAFGILDVEYDTRALGNAHFGQPLTKSI